MNKLQFALYYEIALKIAIFAHCGQKDIGNEPYILHPLLVSENCHTDKGKITALLHDVVEDSDLTIEDIKKRIPDEEILIALKLLTKSNEDRSGQGYQCYLCRIRNNPIACEVKMADLRHNMDLSRISRPLTNWDFRRQEKYRKSLEYLQQKNISFS